jgi:hypothetical protein
MGTIKTLTIDIINDKAMKLLQDMELLKLIRVRKENVHKEEPLNRVAKYKGAMQKQPMSEIDKQLDDIRSSWE